MDPNPFSTPKEGSYEEIEVEEQEEDIK